MTSYSPRIYIYKITFEEVPYYYYGVHKEKVFGEKYLGTPVTHKWCWDFYTPKKQILELFPYTDEGWKEAQEVEKRLIKPFYQTDKWCLNESCGGKTSLEVLRKNGKITGRKNYENGVGIHGLTKEEKIEFGKKLHEMKIGFHSLTKEQIVESARIGGQKCYELGVGVHGRNKEQIIEDGKKGGQKVYKEGKGIHARTKEQMTEDGKKGGKIGGKISTSQRWMCTITGFVTNPGNLSKYQKVKDIDTSNRIRIL